MFIVTKDLKKAYGEGGSYMQVLKGISIKVEKGEMCVIQGTSGSGKSTLLNCIGGLDTIDSGSVSVDGTLIGGLKGEKLSDYRRDNLGFIFQFYNLVPNLTVRENIQVCEYLTRDPLGIDELINVLGLTEHQYKFPSQLSGGQQQRVSIARGLAVDPDIIFMDEPFGALDAITRMKLQEDILRISREEKKTVIFVTHDIEEAVFLADRIVVMMADPGRIKSIVTVPLHGYRDRTSGDFLRVRDKIFELFNMKTDTTIEYVI